MNIQYRLQNKEIKNNNQSIQENFIKNQKKKVKQNNIQVKIHKHLIMLILFKMTMLLPMKKQKKK